jgi:hypothetical protein
VLVDGIQVALTVVDVVLLFESDFLLVRQFLSFPNFVEFLEIPVITFVALLEIPVMEIPVILQVIPF